MLEALVSGITSNIIWTTICLWARRFRAPLKSSASNQAVGAKRILLEMERDPDKIAYVPVAGEDRPGHWRREAAVVLEAGGHARWIGKGQSAVRLTNAGRQRLYRMCQNPIRRRIIKPSFARPKQPKRQNKFSGPTIVITEGGAGASGQAIHFEIDCPRCKCSGRVPLLFFIWVECPTCKGRRQVLDLG